ncbi:GcpE protein-domain-containing protein [Ochromonadaceae sp. CCMP2298]|nr:GcpE protein-domain-containing protein [Ochromonadaceae sp. CCMP2298]
MYLLGWDYPLHLGVTEAGEGEDGRMKSAIGIGSLLADGLGDTVRVSLTEDPEFELGPCQKLIDIGTQLLETPSLFERIPAWTETTRDFSVFTKRRGDLPEQMEGDEADIRGYLHRDGSVLSVVTPAELASPEKLYKGLGARMVMGMPFKDIDTADSIYLPTVPTTEDKNARRVIKRLQDVAVGVLAPLAQLLVYPFPHAVAVLSMAEYVEMNGKPPLPEMAMRFAVQVTGIEEASIVAMLILSVPEGVSRVHGSRRCFQMLSDIGSNLPVIHAMGWGAALSNGQSDLVSDSGSSGEITKVGALLVDGLGDGVMLSDPGFGLETTRKTSFGLLQGARMRSTKTDFVSCPSCGRTLFDLQEVTEQIKQKTGHLPGVAVAIMGCIVNGPGEMADADFGYVGGAPGKVDLYVGRDVVKRGIANALACDALVELIKENGRWVDPRPVEEMASA